MSLGGCHLEEDSAGIRRELDIVHWRKGKDGKVHTGFLLERLACGGGRVQERQISGGGVGQLKGEAMREWMAIFGTWFMKHVCITYMHMCSFPPCAVQPRLCIWGMGRVEDNLYQAQTKLCYILRALISLIFLSATTKATVCTLNNAA